jgi:hypothetical protein
MLERTGGDAWSRCTNAPGTAAIIGHETVASHDYLAVMELIKTWKVAGPEEVA